MCDHIAADMLRKMKMKPSLKNSFIQKGYTFKAIPISQIVYHLLFSLHSHKFPYTHHPSANCFCHPKFPETDRKLSFCPSTCINLHLIRSHASPEASTYCMVMCHHTVPVIWLMHECSSCHFARGLCHFSLWVFYSVLPRALRKKAVINQVTPPC